MLEHDWEIRPPPFTLSACTLVANTSRRQASSLPYNIGSFAEPVFYFVWVGGNSPDLVAMGRSLCSVACSIPHMHRTGDASRAVPCRRCPRDRSLCLDDYAAATWQLCYGCSCCVVRVSSVNHGQHGSAEEAKLDSGLRSLCDIGKANLTLNFKAWLMGTQASCEVTGCCVVLPHHHHSERRNGHSLWAAQHVPVLHTSQPQRTSGFCCQCLPASGATLCLGFT